MEGYVAARVTVEGLKRAGARPSREALITGLESMGTKLLADFSVSLSANDHVASHFVEMSMLTGDGSVHT